MSHARVVKKDNYGKAVPDGYDSVKLSNVQAFADMLGAELEQAGRISPKDAVWIKHNPNSGNLSLEFSSNQKKYYINLKANSLSGNPQDVRGFLSDKTPDAQISSILNQISGKQQNQPQSYQSQQNYQQNQAPYQQNGNQQNGYSQNQQRNGNYSMNAFQQQSNAFSVSVRTGLDRNAPLVLKAMELGNQIADKLGIPPQNKSMLEVIPSQYSGSGLALSLKTNAGMVFLNLNQDFELTRITDEKNILNLEAKQMLMNDLGAKKTNYFLSQETKEIIKNGDAAIKNAVNPDIMTPFVDNLTKLTAQMQTKPSYFSQKDGQYHESKFNVAARHRENSSAITVSISIADRGNYLNIGLSHTSVLQGNPAVKYMTITPKEKENPVLLNLMKAIEQSPEIAKMESYQYHTKPNPIVQKNPEAITAQQTEQSVERPNIRISDMVNVQDSFVMQGIEKMKILAQNVQDTLEHNGIAAEPVIFVGKHGNPPSYVANLEIADNNCQVKLYVNDSSLKSETKPHIYDFSTYDHARGIQGKELTPEMQTAVHLLQENGFFRETELQRFVKEYNENPEHKETTAVYHRAGDVYSDFGKTAHVNTEMAEVLANNGDNRAVPRVYLNAETKKLDVLVRTPDAIVFSRQMTPRVAETLANKYLSAESMQAVCQIADIPAPHQMIQDIIRKAESLGIQTSAGKQEMPKTPKDFLAEVKVAMSIDNRQFSAKPIGSEIGGIKIRMAQNPPREYSIREIINASDSGKTVCPAKIIPVGNKNGTVSHNETGWQSQQMFFVDIDNSIPDTHIPLTKEQGFLTIQDALKCCAENQIQVVSAYESFSSTPELQRFRLTVLLPEPVISLDEHHKIVQGLTSVFGQAADQKCFNGDRIFFGNAPNQKTYQIAKDEQHLYTAKETLLNLYEKNVAPYQQQNFDDESAYVGNLFDLQEEISPEEKLYENILHLEQQGFQGTLQELQQKVSFQGSLQELQQYVDNCGFNSLITEQNLQQSKTAD